MLQVSAARQAPSIRPTEPGPCQSSKIPEPREAAGNLFDEYATASCNWIGTAEFHPWGIGIDAYVDGVPFITFFPAVIITTLISGFGAGVFCVVVSAAAADFFVISPHLALYIERSADAADLILFILEALFYVILITGLRLTLERYRDLSHNLELRVKERSAALHESQERLKAVVAELQHRTRNLISVVGTIAKRTLKRSKTLDDFEASFQDRLEVLGHTQVLLFVRKQAARLPSTNRSIPS
jgi:K+-sensing histidine kinase KdpD